MATKINLYETICTFKNDDYLTSGKQSTLLNFANGVYSLSLTVYG